MLGLDKSQKQEWGQWMELGYGVASLMLSLNDLVKYLNLEITI
jgi:hypothetical protein